MAPEELFMDSEESEYSSSRLSAIAMMDSLQETNAFRDVFQQNLVDDDDGKLHLLHEKPHLHHHTLY